MAVEQIGRLFFLVDSHSRPAMRHTCDLEPITYDDGERTITIPAACDCEAFRLLGHRPCRHLRECADWIVERMELPLEVEGVARQRLQTALEQLFL